VPYEAHVRWALRYEDKRFRKDPHFPFQVFGVCQKRQVCRASVLQIKKGSYSKYQNLLSTITAEDLTKASQEETRGVPFTNPAVRTLRTQLTAVKTRVQGSDESRISIRSKIWGTNLLHNPPSLWVTINPSDTQDPIAQVLAGADIDLDQFCKTAGPDSVDRAINIASDPYASAKYFHLMIETILETLIGISKRQNGIIDRKEGIFGSVNSYVGTVEAQGRGSLHLHLLLWLRDAPTARELKNALSNDIFRDKIKLFIQRTIRADLGMKETTEVEAMTRIEAVSYSRPLDPRKTADVIVMETTEQALARTTQLHKCSFSNCLKTTKGRTWCKRRAPFPLAQDDWVDSLGGWGPKRLCTFLNNWNSPLMMTLRANHDVKLIMNGGDTNILTWYITNYASKKQQ
jgi:Helitron helicase-like domain at N-terminus